MIYRHRETPDLQIIKLNSLQSTEYSHIVFPRKFSSHDKIKKATVGEETTNVGPENYGALPLARAGYSYTDAGSVNRKGGRWGMEVGVSKVLSECALSGKGPARSRPRMP